MEVGGSTRVYAQGLHEPLQAGKYAKTTMVVVQR